MATRNDEQSRKKQGIQRQKHIPQRTCIACRQTGAKRGLIRLVRTAEGEVMIDETGKQKGRGAYLCHNPACWAAALKRRALERALRLEALTAESLERVAAFARRLEETVAESTEP